MAHAGKAILTPPKHGPHKRARAWRGWLPALGAEVMLFAPFLFWLIEDHNEYHGFAVVYAWIIYGLLALSFLLLWTSVAREEDSDRR